MWTSYARVMRRPDLCKARALYLMKTGVKINLIAGKTTTIPSTLLQIIGILGNGMPLSYNTVIEDCHIAPLAQ